MFKLTGLKLTSRYAAFGLLAISAVAFSAPASATPYPPFPFAAPPAPPLQATPQHNGSAAFELPARFRRQIVNYPTHETPGTIIIDTPHTYLYYVLAGGQAIRYGIGVGREGFTWAGAERVSRMAEAPGRPSRSDSTRRHCKSARCSEDCFHISDSSSRLLPSNKIWISSDKRLSHE